MNKKIIKRSTCRISNERLVDLFTLGNTYVSDFVGPKEKPKIFTREALEKLKLTSNDWFIDAEIIIQASRLNFSIKEIPTIFYVNKQRSSFLKFKAILEFISNLIRYRIKMFKGTLLD